MSEIAKELKKTALQSTAIKLCGRNAMTRDLFRVLFKQREQKIQFLVLSTSEGRVLSFICDDEEDETMEGYCVPAKERRELYPAIKEFKCGEDYVLLTDSINTDIEKIHFMLLDVLKSIDANEQWNEKLLKSLDVVQNSISIYDKEARVIFANKMFYEDFHIDTKESLIGMKITDIADKFGLDFVSFDKTSYGKFKMFDVLNEGKEALDWEIRLEYTKSGEPSKLVSNDMYPVMDAQGRVKGLVEITHSRQQDVKNARKIVGLSAGYTFADIIGSSSQIQQKIHIAKEYAKSEYSVLITGESGVGKELFAQAIHNYSPKKKGPFVALNCANFPENLIESELFGYVGGAFTGASKKGSIGKFELANHGTLFLDEIGELPYHFQSKLLRVLETMTVTRIGSNQGVPVDVRIVAATNRDLKQMVKDGFFREDLYFRLSVLNVDVPPLRERKEDLLQLANVLLSQGKDPSALNAKSLSEDSKKILEEYDWPGNVRELRNVLSRASILSRNQEISGEILKHCIDPYQMLLEPEQALASNREDTADASDSTYYEEAYRKYLDTLVLNTDITDDNKLAAEFQETQKKLLEILVRKALDYTNGNKKRAAELLMISRKTLYNILNREKWDV